MLHSAQTKLVCIRFEQYVELGIGCFAGVVAPHIANGCGDRKLAHRQNPTFLQLQQSRFGSVVSGQWQAASVHSPQHALQWMQNDETGSDAAGMLRPDLFFTMTPA